MNEDKLDRLSEKHNALVDACITTRKMLFLCAVLLFVMFMAGLIVVAVHESRIAALEGRSK